MSVAKPVRTITRQRILFNGRCISAIETSLVSIFGMSMMFGVRKIDFFSLLNRHTTKFSIGAVREFSSAVQVKEVPKELNRRFLLKVNFTKYLEVANILDTNWVRCLVGEDQRNSACL